MKRHFGSFHFSGLGMTDINTVRFSIICSEKNEERGRVSGTVGYVEQCGWLVAGISVVFEEILSS
jgi:hypothetical protein